MNAMERRAKRTSGSRCGVTPMEATRDVGKDLYLVAVKAFLVRGRELFLFKDRFGDWDLPGGRLTKSDFDRSLESVLRRKLAQELGASITYSLKALPIY